MPLSQWIPFASINIESGRLIVCDPSLFPDGITVDIRPGIYIVEIAILVNSGDIRVGKIRAVFEDAVTTGEVLSIGGVLGGLSVDFARVTIGDQKAMLLGAQEIDSMESSDSFLEALKGPKKYGMVPWGKSSHTETPWVESGSGDGCYSVRELIGSRDRIGIEVSFIEQLDL